jgi:hypothetical protein
MWGGEQANSVYGIYKALHLDVNLNMHITIPKPCHQNWNDMDPTQQGAFCKACAKTVIDFSVMSDEEVIAYLESRKSEKICGRFNTGQLSPYQLKVNLQHIKTGNKLPRIFAAALFMVFSSFFICKSETGAPVPVNVVYFDTRDTVTPVQHKPETPKADTVPERNMILGEMVAFPPVHVKDSVVNIKPPQVVHPNCMTMGKVRLLPVENKAEPPSKPTPKKVAPELVKGDVKF